MLLSSGNNSKVIRDRLIHGSVRVLACRRIGAIQFAHRTEKSFDNAIVNSGIDNILQTLGNKITPIYFQDIGVGDGNAPVSGSEPDLVGANKFWKAVLSADVVYVRPNLLLTISLGYNEALFTLKEYGVRDNNDMLVSRYVDPAPILDPKTTNDLVMVQWQYTIPQIGGA